MFFGLEFCYAKICDLLEIKNFVEFPVNDAKALNEMGSGL